ncbi:lipocalin-like domain-containing protein [Litorisediminicola beolgyonensis]|uniref:Lipocalin-like domain-containing protein n=1 Tax=Litorisediminicola beolgyonensis TaxID=1173614 RepID=A0ABW3ZGP5_9RHOB
MIARTASLLLVIASGAAAQGYAGLGTEAEGFAVPDPDKRLTFPEDHFPHPDFRIEWWYITATLDGADGQDYGLQWTLFRTGLVPPGPDTPGTAFWLGHAAVTSAETHLATERFGRGDLGQAGVTEPFEAFIDDWVFTSTAEPGADPFSAARLTARGTEFSYDVALTAEGPLVLQGDAGYSVKSESGQSSYYYSQPFYAVDGTLSLPSGTVEVTGSAWLDREWSSQPLAEDQDGWDWFSLSFDDGAKLMAFGLRDSSGGHFTSATWIEPDGTPTPYGNGAVRVTALETAQVAKREIPVRWRVELPERGLDIETAPLNRDAWMDLTFSYWEGPIRVSGTHPGRGYLEMTGY